MTAPSRPADAFDDPASLGPASLGPASLQRSAGLRARAEAPEPRNPSSARGRGTAHTGTGEDWPRPPACLTAAHLGRPPGGARVAVCGLVIVRQRPGSAKGVLFVTLEDETGIVNVVVWARVYEAHRRAVLAGRLLRVTGRIQRDGPVVHVVAERIEDVSHLLDTLTDRRFEPPQAAADEVRRPQRQDPRGRAGRPSTAHETDLATDPATGPATGLVRGAAPRAMHPREQARHLFRRPAGPD